MTEYSEYSAPGPSFLESMRTQTMKWRTAFSELCDNSFDADATRIDIAFSKSGEIYVEDNGVGIKDIGLAMALGSHVPRSTTSLGAFGVGLKDAACWFWGTMKLETRHNGTRQRTEFDWEWLSNQEKWLYPTPTTCNKKTYKSGTKLSFRDVQRSCGNFDALLSDLSYTFAPALWSGRQITMKFPGRHMLVCSGWQVPNLQEAIEDTFTVNGKGVHIRVGIVDVGCVNSRPGFSICYGHRIVKTTSYGSMGKSVSRICGIVELDRAWGLGKHKSEIVDSDSDELEQAINERCLGILETAASQASEIYNSDLQSEVTINLQGLLKEKRNPPGNEEPGTVKPKDTKRKRTNASKIQNGPGSIVTGRIGKIRMEWMNRNDDQIGEVDLPGNVIYLNPSHGRLAYHKATENSGALVDICMTLLIVAVRDEEYHGQLPFKDYGGLVETLSGVLQSQQDTEEKRHDVYNNV